MPPGGRPIGDDGGLGFFSKPLRPLEAVHLPPRKIFAPALLSGASYVTVWHKRTFGWPAPSAQDRQWSYYIACCGRHLRITVLESVVLTHDGFVFVE